MSQKIRAAPRWLRTCLLLAVLGVAAVALAGVSSKNLARTERTHAFAGVAGPLTMTSTLADVASKIGTLGIVWTSGNIAGDTQATATSTLGGIPAPARLYVAFADGGSASTPSCSTMVLAGRDQFGRDVYETLSDVNETPQYTAYVYEELEYLKVTGCASHDLSDRVVVTVSKYLGLQRDLSDETQVISFCIRTPGSAITQCRSGQALNASYSSAFDFEKDTFNHAAYDAVTNQITEYDYLYFRVRNPLRIP